MNKFLYIIVFCFIGCNSTPNEPKQAFYFWRNQLDITQVENSYLDKSTSEFLYTRFFDVDKINGKFQPIGLANVTGNFDPNKKIVPVIYIVNRVWDNISKQEIDFLVDKIVTSIARRAQDYNIPLYDEIQIDSDWTTSTQKSYFTFLEELKAKTNGQVSCTIRLHQVKNRDQTGIPPVDKGYLMCYATSSPLDNNPENSILDIDLLKAYLSNLSTYPLQLDMAFPIYSWGIVTNHLGKKRLINGITSQALQSIDKFVQLNENTYQVEKDGFYFGMYMTQGFTIKVEEISEDILLESITYINQKWKKPYQLIWYHLDERFITKYPNLIP